MRHPRIWIPLTPGGEPVKGYWISQRHAKGWLQYVALRANREQPWTVGTIITYESGQRVINKHLAVIYGTFNRIDDVSCMGMWSEMGITAQETGLEFG